METKLVAALKNAKGNQVEDFSAKDFMGEEQKVDNSQ